MSLLPKCTCGWAGTCNPSDCHKNESDAGATAYAKWKVQANEAKKLLERIIMDHALGIEMNVELYRQIKTFLDGSK